MIMFFNKTQPTSRFNSVNVSIIGTSAQAVFFAYVLQNSGCDVTIVVAPHLLPFYSKQGSFCIKSSRFQAKHANFHFAAEIPSRCNFCFIASTPGQARSDLLLLKPDSLQTTVLVNLSAIYNHRILEELNTVNSLTSFFDCQLSFAKNTVELLDQSPKIDIIDSGDNLDLLQELFVDSMININIVTANKNFLWQRLAPYFIANLLTICYQKSISSLLLQKDLRRQVDASITEILSLAKSDKVSLNASDILARIYTFADDYTSDIKTIADFHAFSSLIKGINHFDTPSLSALLNTAANKY